MSADNATVDPTVQRLRAWLDAEAPSMAPRDLAQRIDMATRTARPRPSWLARLEGHQMDVIEGGRRPAVRFGLIYVILALAAAALVGVLAIGSQRANPVIAPVVTPTLGAPTQTPSVGGAASMEPLPDSLLGAWYGSGPQFMWFLRGGDSICSAFARTNGDCTIVEPAAGVRSGGAVGLQDGELVVDWTSGYCNAVVGRYRFTLTGDSLALTEQPGGCQGGNLALTRAGTGSAPTAPPAPTP